ncbi:DUF3887 domain-containing protein [Gordonia rhizosphera]|uniref:DUF3887 domain-containing protein n=1 Tax=Gordonia rhizosphera NBRC 16068 TaxID=1108045 RepID=K6WUE3_9ACTN|nr:DUF3887 domain-containing protein [Gordonia rhizosphera]GAB90174.1 hypothetical protein GORHZ_087_00030 [Gordonia rhizosphera NBRC 16068]
MPQSLTDLVAALRHDLDAILAAPVLDSTDEPLSTVRTAANVQARSGDVVAAAVQRARRAGRTWQQIGDALGISRQAAFQRFGRPIDPRTGEAMNTTPLPEAVGIAETVLDDLAHSRWDDVAARFDATVAEKLNADGLAAAWAQVVGTVGTYERHGDVEASRAADFTITNTPLVFEAGDFVARITFRDDQTIAGLFILPPELAK